jgi:chromosome segregation ATPase
VIALKKAESQYIAQIKTLEQIQGDFEAKTLRLEVQLKESEAENSHLKSEVSKLTENQSLSTEVGRELESKLTLYKRRIERMEQTVGDLQSELSKAEKQYADLQAANSSSRQNNLQLLQRVSFR